jgi:hypothetical protein
VIGTITAQDDLIEVAPNGVRAEPGVDKLVSA